MAGGLNLRFISPPEICILITHARSVVVASCEERVEPETSEIFLKKETAQVLLTE